MILEDVLALDDKLVAKCIKISLFHYVINFPIMKLAISFFCCFAISLYLTLAFLSVVCSPK